MNNDLRLAKARVRANVWYSENKERAKANSKRARLAKPDLYRQIDRNKRLAKPELYKKIERDKRRRYRLLPHFRLKEALSCRIYNALCGRVKSDTTLNLLGCPIQSFKIYIESKFEPGMTWANYGKEWHLDHIMPCAIFDLTRPEHQKRCFHFSNLQPLWARDNLIKGAKVQAHG